MLSHKGGVKEGEGIPFDDFFSIYCSEAICLYMVK